jgi:hypothetical protein
VVSFGFGLKDLFSEIWQFRAVARAKKIVLGSGFNEYSQIISQSNLKKKISNTFFWFFSQYFS